MKGPYTHIADLAKQAEPPVRGVKSRMIYHDDQVKAVVMGLDRAQLFPEQTTAHSSMIQVLRGEALVWLNDEKLDLQTGAWLHLPAGVRHSIRAKTPLVILVLLFKI
jgi:quercetin dioxygenase-like cupin family protein